MTVLVSHNPGTFPPTLQSWCGRRVYITDDPGQECRVVPNCTRVSWIITTMGDYRRTGSFIYYTDGNSVYYILYSLLNYMAQVINEGNQIIYYKTSEKLGKIL